MNRVIRIAALFLALTGANPSFSSPQSPWAEEAKFVDQETGKYLIFKPNRTVLLYFPRLEDGRTPVMTGKYETTDNGARVTVTLPDTPSSKAENLVLQSGNLVDVRGRVWKRTDDVGRVTTPAASQGAQANVGFIWSPLEFTRPTPTAPDPDLTLATTHLNYRFKYQVYPLTLNLSRKNSQTVFTMGVGNCWIAGDPHNPDSVREVREMLERAQDWAAKARANGILHLEKMLFKFSKTRFTTKYLDERSFIIAPATFFVGSEKGKIAIWIFFEVERFDESDWPAFKFAVDHMQDIVASYEQRAIPIEQSEAARKKKEDELFRP